MQGLIPTKTVSKKPNNAILFLYEGDTEGGFYDTLFEKLNLNRNAQIKKKCLNGNININAKVADKTYAYLENGKNDHVSYLTVFVAYDREGDRSNEGKLNADAIRSKLRNKRLKAIHEIIATQMLESWFFIDIDGIYDHLDMPKTKREPDKYKDYEKFRHEDLHDLFRKKDKNSRYFKGDGCIPLIKALDLMKILDNCDDLKTGMNRILQTAGLKTRK